MLAVVEPRPSALQGTSRAKSFGLLTFCRDTHVYIQPTASAYLIITCVHRCPVTDDQRTTVSKHVSKQTHSTRILENQTHHRCRLVIQDSLDLVQNLGCQLGNDFQRLQVVEHLLGLGRAKNDRARVRVLGYPC